MEKCETCKNEYDKPLRIERDGQMHVFDSFECAIQALAPVCSHCNVRVIGHGVEGVGAVFCCASCARMAGERSLRDRAAG